ncbi:MAG: TRAP transporter small permease subunit [Mailhella sp.]|nr:TRAP transporter small permease subunit [Mailhella sp.]
MISLLQGLYFLFDRLSKALSAVCKVVLVISLFGIVFDLGIGCILRYTIKYVPSWYEELARFLLVWIAFSGSVVAVEKGGHISLDIFGACSFRVRAFFRLLAHILMLVTAVMVCWYGWRFAQGGWFGVFACMDFMHLFYGYVGVPLCFLGVGLVALRNIIGNITELVTGAAAA